MVDQDQIDRIYLQLGRMDHRLENLEKIFQEIQSNAKPRTAPEPSTDQAETNSLSLSMTPQEIHTKILETAKILWPNRNQFSRRRIATYATNALVRAGITSVKSIRKAFPSRIKDLPYIGPDTLEAIRAAFILNHE